MGKRKAWARRLALVVFFCLLALGLPRLILAQEEVLSGDAEIVEVPKPAQADQPAATPETPVIPGASVIPETSEIEATPEPPGPAADAASEPAEVDDQRIEAHIRERFALIEALQDIQVQSAGGVVQLAGEVVKNNQREIAQKLAEAAPGVVAVENQLEVTQDVRQRTLPALQQAGEKFRRLLGAIPLLLIGLTVLALFILVATWLSNLKVLDRLIPRQRFTNNLLRQGIYYAGVLAGAVVVLDLLDATAWVGALLGTAGIVGLAVGFGVKDLVENQFASVLLSLRQPFAPNDHVLIDGQYEGKVISLNSRATILMTLEGNHLRLPNAFVFKSIILNYTRNPKRRIDLVMGVGVNEDVARAQALGVEVLRGMAGVLQDPSPMALILDLGASSVNVQYFAWVDQRNTNFLKVRSEAIRLVKAALEAAEMDLPEPIYRINIEGGSARLPPTPSAPPRPRRRVPETTQQADVSPDHTVDELIAEEQAVIGKDNLLDRTMPRE